MQTRLHAHLYNLLLQPNSRPLVRRLYVQYGVVYVERHGSGSVRSNNRLDQLARKAKVGGSTQVMMRFGGAVLVRNDVVITIFINLPLRIVDDSTRERTRVNVTR